MNYLTYPIKTMNITQSYTGNLTHGRHNTGNPKDYPIDDNCGSTGKTGYFYCPCDEMIVKKIYGVGISSGNTLWLESTSPVITPTFNDYITIMITHPNDKDFEGIYVGKKYTRGQKIIIEGNDGNATGYHFHIAVGRGKFLGSGWQKNSNGAWVIKTTEGGIKPEEAFFIDNSFTTIRGTKGINFISLGCDRENNKVRYITYNLNVRYGPGTNYNILNTLPKNTKVTVYEEQGTWSRISDREWLSSKYLTESIPSVSYETKVTTADLLNVRKTPNGKVLTENAPLVKNTTVAIMGNSGNWTKINANRYVYTDYLK